MAEIIRWDCNTPEWVLEIRAENRSEIGWSLTSPQYPDNTGKKVYFQCPKSKIPEIIAALTKLALEGEE